MFTQWTSGEAVKSGAQVLGTPQNQSEVEIA